MTSNRIPSSSGSTRAFARRARRHLPLAAIVAALLLAAGSVAAGQTQIPASATLRDESSGDEIVSDGAAYDQSVDCVVSRVQNGQYFLRTVSPSCTQSTPRTITLDFSNAVTAPSNCSVVDPNSGKILNACGSNPLPDVRIIAQALFKTSASSTTVLLPFSLKPDFSGTAFELDFEQAVPFTGSGILRVLTAGSDAVAELYQIGKHGSKVSIGRYKMPFQLTVMEH
jgi:hypothetical protein